LFFFFRRFRSIVWRFREIVWRLQFFFAFLFRLISYFLRAFQQRGCG
jgi:hypothetical protein